jgi:hypothetical protein
VAIAAFASIFLGGVAAWSTYLLRQERSQQKVTYELVECLLTDPDTALNSGATSKRKAWSTALWRGCRSFSAGPLSDADLCGLLFGAYLKLGDIQGNGFTTNLGDAAAAKRSYQSAREEGERTFSAAGGGGAW